VDLEFSVVVSAYNFHFGASLIIIINVSTLHNKMIFEGTLKTGVMMLKITGIKDILKCFHIENCYFI